MLILLKLGYFHFNEVHKAMTDGCHLAIIIPPRLHSAKRIHYEYRQPISLTTILHYSPSHLRLVCQRDFLSSKMSAVERKLNNQ